ncbi:MAG TPA: FAD-dependent oxidoreductase [Acidimicrobiales bacterium]|nr:FAD-dependent oxidoreductase [Acidimicrobiales bacterium]
MAGRVIIVGGGVGGLTAALGFARAGHQVTLLERDEVPDVHDVEAAFDADRRGAPQVHQTHGFLARLVVELREHLPDVLDALLDAGCVTMPTTAQLGEPQPGDEDLRVLVVRRTTLEWVLRRAVDAEPGVTVHAGVLVKGLLGRPASAGDPAVVTGVVDETGTAWEGSIVVAATGRRGPIDRWLADLAVELPETVHESGLMYLSRWYRFAEPDTVELDPKLGGDLGFVKYLAVPGDAGTLSITLAVRTDDRELRSALSDEDTFEHACRILPGPDRFVGRYELEPIGGVRPMTGLLNRVRRFLDADCRPLAIGFHVVGDSHTTTNPLYGRGCSLAAVQAIRVVDAAVAHPDDPVARAIAYEQACQREVEPWFEVSVQMDRMGADPGAIGFGGGRDGDAGRGMAAVFAAAQTDPIIGRGISRFMNLLATPLDLMGDAALMARMAEVMADPDSYPPPPVEGPTRAELLDALGVPQEDTVPTTPATSGAAS